MLLIINGRPTRGLQFRIIITPLASTNTLLTQDEAKVWKKSNEQRCPILSRVASFSRPLIECFNS